MPDFLDVRQVLHYLNQPQHRADDADGGCISSRGLKDLRFGFPMMLLHADFELHGLPNDLQIRAVYRQVESFAQEWVLNRVSLMLQRDDAALASLGSVPDDFFHDGLWVVALLEEN